MKQLALFLCLLGIIPTAIAESDRPDLDLEFLQKPYVVKSMYRETWMADNVPDLSAITQLELMQAHSPDLDVDTHKITDRGIKTLKSIQFGSKDTDLSTKSQAIQGNPTDSLSQLTHQIQHKKSAIDALEVADTIKPVERLNEKVDKQNKIGTQSYDIDIDLFK